MPQYDRRVVTAPQWMEHFQCIAGECPETCCQQWNIEVDPVHADRYTHLGDPELQAVMSQLLRTFRVRRPGKRNAEVQYRLQLLNAPDRRCPILNENGECRLQKKYGAYILCDTCYFHPRTFCQIDEQIWLSACLSCPECARLALLHREPTGFVRFEAEIDPNAEWLETSLMPDPGAQMLMRNRDAVISAMCTILQQRDIPIRERIAKAVRFLEKTGEADPITEEAILQAAAGSEKESSSRILPEDADELMKIYPEVFDPVSEGIEKPVQGSMEFTRALAGGRQGFIRLLAENYAEGCRIMEPFLAGNEHLLENFLVHCVFSDSFKQFYRCQNIPLTVRDILRHESAILQIWYFFLRVQLSRAALVQGRMDEDIFLKTVIYADKTWWHYPDWFARCAERYADMVK